MKSTSTPKAQPMPPSLRHWLWLNFGYDIYDWQPNDIRF